MCFCASGLDGVIRNLTTGEILEQLLRLALLLPETERISHIVVMGMGEPLANLDRLLPALARAAECRWTWHLTTSNHYFYSRSSTGNGSTDLR